MSDSDTQNKNARRMSSSSLTLPCDMRMPRLCRVIAKDKQLGFTVMGSRANPGIFKINDIIPNSPAARSGLQNDDLIIEISGINVELKDYAEVIELIKVKKAEDDLELLVADRETLNWHKSRHIPISSQLMKILKGNISLKNAF